MFQIVTSEEAQIDQVIFIVNWSMNPIFYIDNDPGEFTGNNEGIYNVKVHDAGF